MVQKNWNFLDFILIIVAILRNFYIFLAIIISESIYNVIALRYSSNISNCNSKIIISKNLEKFWGIATIIRIMSTEFQIFWTITMTGIKNWYFNAKNPMLFRWETYIAGGTGYNWGGDLKLGGYFFLFIPNHKSPSSSHFAHKIEVIYHNQFQWHALYDYCPALNIKLYKT